MDLSLMLSVLISVSFVVLISLYIHFRLVGSKYWSNRNVPHVKPVFLLGPLWRAGIFENMGEMFAKMYLENRAKKLLGLWFVQNPSLLVMDQELIKRILIKDFNNFRDRGIEVDTERDPLAGHLFMLNGKKWRNLRVKLTPTFTSGKMKMMFPTMSQCGKELQEILKKPAEDGEDVEVKDVVARYATDVISSCAFGLETNSLQNPNSEFREFGKKIFNVDTRTIIINFFLISFPKLMKILKIRLVPKNISDFFIGVVRDNIEHREKTQTKRNDFLQLLIQLMRAGKIEDADRTPIDDLTDEELVQKFSLHEAAAQCFIFFAAGFETSSTAVSFGLYELALNPDIQKRLQDEIDSMMMDLDGDVTYEKLHDLEYLDMVVQETLRKYPPVGTLQRKCMKDYKVPELGLTIDKDVVVMLSVTGMHRDPDLYPDPDRFDPERFTEKEKAKRDTCAFLPFGEGPRNCIGNRFGLMQIKIALYYILSKYTVEVTKNTPIPIEYEVRSFIPTPVGGMNLLFKKRV